MIEERLRLLRAAEAERVAGGVADGAALLDQLLFDAQRAALEQERRYHVGFLSTEALGTCFAAVVQATTVVAVSTIAAHVTATAAGLRILLAMFCAWIVLVLAFFSAFLYPIIVFRRVVNAYCRRSWLIRVLIWIAMVYVLANAAMLFGDFLAERMFVKPLAEVADQMTGGDFADWVIKDIPNWVIRSGMKDPNVQAMLEYFPGESEWYADFVKRLKAVVQEY
jgi:hypothetical protein